MRKPLLYVLAFMAELSAMALTSVEDVTGTYIIMT